VILFFILLDVAMVRGLARQRRMANVF
jgi:hypothetical protein